VLEVLVERQRQQLPRLFLVVVEPLVVDIITKLPDPILPNKIASVFMMSRSWSERNNAARPQNTRQREEMHTVRNTNGTGAFRLTARESDVRTVMTRNTDWWGWREDSSREANVTEIIFRPIASDATRIAALLSGEVDFVLDPPLQDLNRLRQAQNIRVLEGPEVRTIFLAMDVYRDELLYSDVKGRNPMKDLRVRQALYHAIDIQAIHRTTMRGQSVVTGTFFPSQVNGYVKEEDVRLPYDAARARALLAEAGFPNGFEITLDCPNNRYINDEQICQAVVAMWARVGIRAKLNAMPLAPFFAKIQKHFGGKEMAGGLSGKKLAFWGIAFKPKTDDIREAPAITLMRKAKGFGAEVSAFDPVANENARKEMGAAFNIVDDMYEAAKGADALVVCTDWDEFKSPNWEKLASLLKSKVLFDGRNLYRPATMKEHGYTHYSVGRAPVSGK
jgi:ABC-type transport system substrate-binding protein